MCIVYVANRYTVNQSCVTEKQSLAVSLVTHDAKNSQNSLRRLDMNDEQIHPERRCSLTNVFHVQSLHHWLEIEMANTDSGRGPHVQCSGGQIPK